MWPAPPRRASLQSPGNRLVIIVPADSTLKIQAPADLATDAVATTWPSATRQSVPAGKYAKQALEKLGIWEKLRPKVAAGTESATALAYVETGAAEAGIVYATDAAVSTKVKMVAEIPENLTGPVQYPLLLLKHAKGREAAESFYRYLASPEAAAVFEKHGFVVLRPRAGSNP